MIIPDECVPYIRWQRSRLSAAKVPDDVEVKRRYVLWTLQDFTDMEPYLPANVSSIVEIGCGMAGIQVYLKRKYPDAVLSLLDGNTVTNQGGAGYGVAADVYNSRECTEKLLEANGVRVDRWIDIGTTEHLKADLILSMASWGYHYPFNTYKVSGFVVVDLRRKVEAKMIDSALRAGGSICYHGVKYERCAFRWGM